MLATVLRRRGYSVLDATSGAEALEVLAAHRQEIRLLVTDIVMPRLNGIELAAEVRELPASLHDVASEN